MASILAASLWSDVEPGGRVGMIVMLIGMCAVAGAWGGRISVGHQVERDLLNDAETDKALRFYRRCAQVGIGLLGVGFVVALVGVTLA